MKRDIAKWS